MEISKPKIKNCEKMDINCALKKEIYSSVYYTGVIEEEISIKDITFDSCIFEKIDFSHINLEGVNFEDVEFRDCDLSNKKFNFKTFDRVVFRNCKMMGTSFIDSSLVDVEFNGCITKYLNLFGSRIDRVYINESDLSEAFFKSIKANHLKFNEVKFLKAEFIRADLEGVDFSTSYIDGACFDFESLKGITVSESQCVSLASMLGVNVRDY